MGKEGRNLYVRQLHGGQLPKLIANNLLVDTSKVTTKAKSWFSIICAHIIPSKDETDVSIVRAQIICAIMKGIKVNVEAIIVQHIQNMVTE